MGFLLSVLLNLFYQKKKKR
ncbi:hypothetical protein DF217_05830 [Streptococcus oralis]|uniref:Uncharacterized protein n=1 Tax=Streptococcus oralis TaxID=1303 RepID=A0A4Q2FNS5_STROR|nr:hypothetical protein DF217_05830 [Streptococcus oralis]